MLVLVTGCGYRFTVEGLGPTIGSRDQRVSSGPVVILAVQEFGNRTFHHNLEYKYTNYVRQEFMANGGARVMYDNAGSDFLLKGEIVSVSIPSLSFSPSTTRESRVQVIVRVTVEEQATGKIIWGQSATGTGEYFVGSISDTSGGSDTLQFNQVLQTRALEQAGQDIAQQLADDFWVARDQGIFSPQSAPDQPQDPSAPSSPTQSAPESFVR